MDPMEEIQPKLQKALDLAGNTHTISDVAAMVQLGQAQLWSEGDGLIVTEIENYPRGRVLNFWLAAGDMDDVLKLTDRAYEWGREMGCTRATFRGRKGWERVLADEGWEPTSIVTYHKEL